MNEIHLYMFVFSFIARWMKVISTLACCAGASAAAYTTGSAAKDCGCFGSRRAPRRSTTSSPAMKRECRKVSCSIPGEAIYNL